MPPTRVCTKSYVYFLTYTVRMYSTDYARSSLTLGNSNPEIRVMKLQLNDRYQSWLPSIQLSGGYSRSLLWIYMYVTELTFTQ